MIDQEVLNSFKKTSLEYMGNTNSLHKLGVDAKKLEVAATKQILNLLHVNNKEVVYTSDRNEANSLAIFGLLEKYKGKNKKVLVFQDCDSSIIDAVVYFKKFSFKIVFIPANDIDYLKRELTDDVVLVCMMTNLEVDKISKLVKDTRQANLLIDMTNDFSFNFDFNMGDFIVFDARSCNAILGIGCLLIKKDLVIEPVFHGGKSTTDFRSGTPALPFIVAFSKALRVMYNNG